MRYSTYLNKIQISEILSFRFIVHSQSEGQKTAEDNVTKTSRNRKSVYYICWHTPRKVTGTLKWMGSIQIMNTLKWTEFQYSHPTFLKPNARKPRLRPLQKLIDCVWIGKRDQFPQSLHSETSHKFPDKAQLITFTRENCTDINSRAWKAFTTKQFGLKLELLVHWQWVITHTHLVWKVEFPTSCVLTWFKLLLKRNERQAILPILMPLLSSLLAKKCRQFQAC